MEILSEWYIDDDVTCLGKLGCGRMDRDVGMATGVRPVFAHIVAHKRADGGD